MIDQKSVIIGLIISIALVVLLGLISAIGQFIGVLVGAFIAAYLANRKNQLGIVESALHGIIVGIFTGIIQILIIFAKTGFSESVAGILMIAALILIGAYIIVGALGGIVGTLIYVKFGRSNNNIDTELEKQTEPDQQSKKMNGDKK
jgi:hypothetical protein